MNTLYYLSLEMVTTPIVSDWLHITLHSTHYTIQGRGGGEENYLQEQFGPSLLKNLYTVVSLFWNKIDLANVTISQRYITIFYYSALSGTALSVVNLTQNIVGLSQTIIKYKKINQVSTLQVTWHWTGQLKGPKGQCHEIVDPRIFHGSMLFAYGLEFAAMYCVCKELSPVSDAADQICCI